MKTQASAIKNWIPDKHGYIFTFAKNREAIGVKVDLAHGTIREDEDDRLREISDHIIQKGLPPLKIGPGELKAISHEDYLSDKYTHPADALTEKAK
ncbi:hypothetical protein [Desulfonema magnum]|uniref:Uncharacterized protein n=1 Tax=Desulfonema magnum TaxID=45655 RepID=A0A975GLQ0_9BACT|nr:hypothetical protein [Desulfonema magnum]QTA85830.1 Uncharacterized protein dnm_018450 [Desulfonema magnum]